jgi:hypothetical protein
MKQPPSDYSPPQQALWWLKQGDFKVGAAWTRAHEICQMAEGTREYDLVHALGHWIEGDEANRDYWYRRVQPWSRQVTMETEWEEIWKAVSA